MNTTLDAPIFGGFDRLPPHSIEAEMSFLGSITLAGDDRTIIAHARQLVSRDDFYQADNQIIFDTAIRMYDRKQPIDALTLREELKRSGVYEEIGGREYLASIMGSVPSSAHYAGYATTIREKSLLRQLISACNDAIRSAYAPRHGEAIQEAAGELMGLSARLAKIAAGAEAAKVHKLYDVSREIIQRKASGEELRMPTGIQKLDDVIGGLRKGSKTIIGGKPGMGKSSLCKQLLMNLSRCGVRCGIISIEETRYKIAENALANLSGVPNNRIAFGTACEEEWVSIDVAVEQTEKIPLFIVDCARKLSQIVAMAHLLATQHGCEVIAVDHLHIIDGECDENRNIEMTKISAGLKQCWKDLNVAGIEAAQLNRAGGSERPALTNLRDSGSLEADGDVVLLLHRDDYYRKTGNAGPMDNILEVIVAKNKDGACGTVFLNFDEARQLISDDRVPDGPLPMEQTRFTTFTHTVEQCPL